MVVMDGPTAGYATDTMVWRDCNLRHALENIMKDRLQSDIPQRRLKLYADKIYNDCGIVTAAFSLRHGPLYNWMVRENRVMSNIRVAVEWTFGQITSLFKFIDYYKTQKMMESPIEKHQTVAAFLENCHNCI